MIELLPLQNNAPDPRVDDTVTLSFDYRQKSRQRVTLDSGREAAVQSPRGSVLRGGDLLVGGGRVVRVVAAKETVSTVHTDSPRELTRVAYHLGNRHIPLQIGDGFVRYQHDHVLDGMVAAMELAVTCEQAVFEPEGGAYGGRVAHGHSHSDGQEAT